MTKKYCNNCKYKDVEPYLEPCENCGELYPPDDNAISNWEPDGFDEVDDD